MPDGGDGPCVGLAEQGLGPAHGNTLAAAQIVEHDDVTRPQDWHRELCHPCQEQAAADGTVEHARRNNVVGSQAGQERHGRPARVRHRGDQTLSAQGSTVGAGHICLGPGLVDEDQARRVNAVLVALPPLALAGDVGAVLLGGAQSFF